MEGPDPQLVYLQMLLDRGCKIDSKVLLFGKTYVWMKSPQGELFIERVPDEHA